MLHPPSGIVTRQPQAFSSGAACAEPQNKQGIEFVRQLNPKETRIAEELYGQLKGRHRSSSDCSCHCEVSRSLSDRLVGFKKRDEDPVIIQVHDQSRNPIGNGSFGYVFESTLLRRKAGGCWGVPQGEQNKRVMKIQEDTEDARSEIEFHSEQPGSIGAGIFDGFQYLDQLRIPGKCLQSCFEDETWPLKERFECAVAMLVCANTFVAGGYAHPDIKPRNMVYDSVNKEIYFIDNAHVQDLEDPSAVKPQWAVGTPWFLEPDQYRNIETTAKSMVFSLGIVLLNLFSDKPHEYAVARSQVTHGKDIQLDLKLLLPGFRETNPKFVEQLQGFLMQMVSDKSHLRPDLGECLTRLIGFSSAYRLIEDSANEIKRAKAEVAHLQNELKQVQIYQALMKGGLITQQRAAQLKEEGAAKKRELQKMLVQQQVAIKEIKEQQKQKLAEVMRAQQLSFEQLQRVAETSEVQKDLYKKKAEASEGEVKKAQLQLKKLTEEVKRLSGTLIIKDRQLQDLSGRAVKAEHDVGEACTRAEEKSTEYELALEMEKNCHKRALDQLSAAERQNKKLEAELEAEKVSQARKVRQLASKLSENLQAPSDNLKRLARNGGNVDSAEFGKQLPGVLAALPSDDVRILFLEDLATLIFCNREIDGVGKPYNHQSSLRPLSFYARRPVDFTYTQRLHLAAVVAEARALAEKMLKGNDESKRQACQFLTQGFATRVQVTDELKMDNGWAESLLAATPGIAKYQFTQEQVAKFNRSKLGQYFQDGRQGDPGKSKQLSEFMARLETADKVIAAKRLLAMLAIPEPVQNLAALEKEFLSILTRAGAYTRGEQDTVVWLLEYVCESVAGEKHIRQDVDSPSATKMWHIALLRSAYDEALKPLLAKELTPLEIEKLAESRLVNFSPAQYQHELHGCQNDLGYKVTALLESEKNIAAYKDYLHKKFSANFSAYHVSPDGMKT